MGSAAMGGNDGNNGIPTPISLGVLDNDMWACKAIGHWFAQQRGIRLAWMFTNPAAAIAACQSTRHRPDVALIDIMLGSISGLDVCARIREHTDQIGLVCITSYDTANYLTDVAACGAQGIFSKERISNPRERERVFRVLRMAARGESSDPELFPDAASAHTRLAAAAGRSQPHDALRSPLNDTEKTILRLLSQGLTAAQAADQLHANIHTMNTHIRRAQAKLGATSRSEALAICQRHGLLS